MGRRTQGGGTTPQRMPGPVTVLYQTADTADGDLNLNAPGVTASQPFALDEGVQVTTATVLLSSGGTPAGQIQAALYTSVEGAPEDLVAVTAPIPAALVTGDGNEVVFTFATRPILDGGSYHLALKIDTGDEIHWIRADDDQDAFASNSLADPWDPIGTFADNAPLRLIIRGAANI